MVQRKLHPPNYIANINVSYQLSNYTAANRSVREKKSLTSGVDGERIDMQLRIRNIRLSVECFSRQCLTPRRPMVDRTVPFSRWSSDVLALTAERPTPGDDPTEDLRNSVVAAMMRSRQFSSVACRHCPARSCHVSHARKIPDSSGSDGGDRKPAFLQNRGEVRREGRINN